ncbi:hypothetical protein [Dyella sp.]|uniref:hypothetical protein n=1 Tax=Dyella sp. TaxID=1869338 RepID=UPI002ED5783D
MTTNRIEYCVAGSRRHGWNVMRQNRPLAFRQDIYDAVALATHIAEREAHATEYAVKVTFSER